MKKSEFIVLRKDEKVNDLSMNELKGGLGSNNSNEPCVVDCRSLCLGNSRCVELDLCSPVMA